MGIALVSLPCCEVVTPTKDKHATKLDGWTFVQKCLHKTGQGGGEGGEVREEGMGG